MAGTLIVDLIGIPKAFYFQSADPAVANPTHMRAGINWIDTTASPYAWKRRNAANDGWDTMGKIRTDAEFNTDVDGRITAANLATDAELATAISNHEAAANPHPTYLTQAEGDGLYQPLGGVIATAPTTLTDAATIATDASLNNKFRVTLGGNRTLGNPTNALDGQSLTWEITQDGTGSRTLALDTKFVLGTDITDVTLTTAAGKRDFLHAEYNAGTDKFYVRAFVKGY